MWSAGPNSPSACSSCIPHMQLSFSPAGDLLALFQSCLPCRPRFPCRLERADIRLSNSMIALFSACRASPRLDVDRIRSALVVTEWSMLIRDVSRDKESFTLDKIVVVAFHIRHLYWRISYRCRYRGHHCGDVPTLIQQTNASTLLRVRSDYPPSV